MYYFGQGVPWMPATGLNWLYRAAEQDDRTAYTILTAIFEAGGLFAPDHEKTLTWYILATKNERPMLFSGDSMKERKRLEKSLSREQVARARQAATDWVAARPPVGGH
jgi:TPR repeat protein